MKAVRLDDPIEIHISCRAYMDLTCKVEMLRQYFLTFERVAGELMQEEEETAFAYIIEFDPRNDAPLFELAVDQMQNAFSDKITCPHDSTGRPIHLMVDGKLIRVPYASLCMSVFIKDAPRISEVIKRTLSDKVIPYYLSNKVTAEERCSLPSSFLTVAKYAHVLEFLLSCKVLSADTVSQWIIDATFADSAPLRVAAEAEVSKAICKEIHKYLSDHHGCIFSYGNQYGFIPLEHDAPDILTFSK